MRRAVPWLLSGWRGLRRAVLTVPLALTARPLGQRRSHQDGRRVACAAILWASYGQQPRGPPLPLHLLWQEGGLA